MVSWTFLIVFFIVAFLIVGLVLLQEGKGGGLTGMSTGMDGVMGAKNPLRRMTAYLFVFFILMAITINWYFHQREDTSLPTGAAMPASATRTLEETMPIGDTVVRDAVEEGSLRPDLPPAAPVMSIRPEEEGVSEAPATEPVDGSETPVPATEATTPAMEEPTGELRPTVQPDDTAGSLQPPPALPGNEQAAPAAPTETPETVAPAPAAAAKEPESETPAPAALVEEPETDTPSSAAPVEESEPDVPPPAAPPIEESDAASPSPASPVEESTSSTPPPAPPTGDEATTDRENTTE